MNNRVNNLHHRLSQLAVTKWSIWALFIGAFADASFIPLPVTTFFLILILLNTRMIHKYIILAVLGTIAGSLAGYSIGHYVWLKPDGEFTAIVQFLFKNIPGFSQGAYEKVHAMYTKWDFWILCAATATPLPYGMFSVTSCVFDINIFIFFLTTLISQGIKYLLIAFFSISIGPQFRKLTEFDWKPVALIITTGLLIIIVVSKVL